jgi:hypothetical protein
MPNKWLHAHMGEAAREFFQKNKAVETIVNFESYQVFDEATTYTMLIYLKKEKNQSINVYNYVGDLETKNNVMQLIDSDNWEKGSVNYDNLSKSEWNLLVGESQSVFEKISTQPNFGENFTLSSGTGTRAIKVFFVEKLSENGAHYKIYSKQTKKEHEIEKIFVKPSAKGKDIDSYRIKNKNNLLIFPYRNRVLIEPNEIKSKSPKLWTYLKECRDALEKRENGRFKGDKFYCYGRPQNHDKLPQKKILVPVIVNEAKAAWDSEGIHVIDSVYFVNRKTKNVVKDEYLLAILNSKLLTYFLIKTSSNLRGGYFSMKPGYVDNFPLKVDFSTKEEKECYSKIIQYVKRINAIIDIDSKVVEREIKTLKEKIDRLIFNLYGLKIKEKKIIEKEIIS